MKVDLDALEKTIRDRGLLLNGCPIEVWRAIKYLKEWIPTMGLLRKTPENIERLCRLHDLGYSDREVAEQLGWPKSTVSTYLTRYYPDREPRSREYMARMNRINGRKGGKKRSQQR